MISPEARAYDLHGGEGETSSVLAIAPELVRTERIEVGSMRARDLYAPRKHLTLEGALPTAWLTRDLAPTGVLGDPTRAAAEKGEVVLSAIAEGLAAVFEEICGFEFDEEVAGG